MESISKSPDQIIEKPCECFKGRIDSQIKFKLAKNDILDKILKSQNQNPSPKSVDHEIRIMIACFLYIPVTFISFCKKIHFLNNRNSYKSEIGLTYFVGKIFLID